MRSDKPGVAHSICLTSNSMFTAMRQPLAQKSAQQIESTCIGQDFIDAAPFLPFWAILRTLSTVEPERLPQVTEPQFTCDQATTCSGHALTNEYQVRGENSCLRRDNITTRGTRDLAPVALKKLFEVNIVFVAIFDDQHTLVSYCTTRN